MSRSDELPEPVLIKYGIVDQGERDERSVEDDLTEVLGMVNDILRVQKVGIRFRIEPSQTQCGMWVNWFQEKE